MNSNWNFQRIKPKNCLWWVCNVLYFAFHCTTYLLIIFVYKKEKKRKGIIKCYLQSVEVNVISKVTNYTGTVNIFCLHSFTQHFGNHMGEEYTVLHSNPL